MSGSDVHRETASAATKVNDGWIIYQSVLGKLYFSGWLALIKHFYSIIIIIYTVYIGLYITTFYVRCD